MATNYQQKRQEFDKVKFLDAIENYYLDCSTKICENNDSILNKIIQHHPNLSCYRKSHLPIAMMMDLMISLPTHGEFALAVTNFVMKKCLLIEPEQKDYFIAFLHRISEVFITYCDYNSNNSLTTLFNDEIYTLDPSVFNVQIRNRESLKQMIELDIESLNDESVLYDLLPKIKGFNTKICYFNRIYHYVKNIRALVKFDTNEHLNINTIIKELDVHDLIGKIVYTNNYKPELLEKYTHHCNINFLHAIAIAGGTEFSSPLYKSQKYSKENVKINELSDAHNLKYFQINTNIIDYLKKSGSFLVAYLITEIQNFNHHGLKYDEPNYFERMKNLDSVKSLCQLYNNKLIVAILNYDYLEMDVLYHEMCKLEDKEKLSLISHVSDRNICRNKKKFNDLKNSVIASMMAQKSSNIEMLLKHIENPHKFVELLLKHINDISCDKELEAFLMWSSISRNLENVEENVKIELENWLKKIKIYRQILILIKTVRNQEDISWTKIMQYAENETSVLIDFLINESTNLELCNDLLKLHHLQSKSHKVYDIFINALNSNKFDDKHDKLLKIIKNYAANYLSDFIAYAIGKINNSESMKFLLDYIKNYNISMKNQIEIQKYELSWIIIEHIDSSDSQLWSLKEYPLILLEQLLMNSKIEHLTIIYKELRKILQNEPSCNLCNITSNNYKIGEVIVYDFDGYHKDCKISNDCLDFLLKIYAAKALDFQIIDVATQSNLSTGTQSADNIHIHQMPKNIPSKEEWVPDNEATFCMCCRKSKFSLLNRRHHCRRLFL